MKVLGIETATAVCAAALADESGTLAERSVVETHIHSEKLLTLVQEVCEEAHVALAALDAVAVSIGPGSFTGLRIGLSAAKGLCVALGCPLIAVPTFDAIASHVLNDERAVRDLAICLDARQGDFYVGRYRRGTEGPVTAAIVAAMPLSAVTWWGETDRIVTDALRQVQAVVPDSVPILDAEAHSSASSVAWLGLRMLKAGKGSSVGELEPMYLKDFIVKSPKQQT
jgi:tRNA threonylcarbamoyladenosine biosynthesis protein TsaB